MKFRATLIDATGIRQFSNIIHTLSKLSKTCLLRIQADRLCFIVPEEHYFPHNVSVWAILHKDEFFHKYVLTVDDNNSEIGLEFDPDMLSTSLNVAKGGAVAVKSLTIRLARKVTTCISLELELASGNSGVCVHDVPIEIIPDDQLKSYKEPSSENYDVGVNITSIKMVKSIVDKMKKINNRLTMKATAASGFSLRVQSLSATIETHFKDCVLKPPKEPREIPEKSEVSVDGRKISQFLTYDSGVPSTITCYLVSNKMIHLCISHTGFELNYYLSALEE